MMHLGCILEGLSAEESEEVPAPFPPVRFFSCPAPRVVSLMQWQRLWKKEVNEGRGMAGRVPHHWEQVLRIWSFKDNNIGVQDGKKNSFEGQRIYSFLFLLEMCP